MTIGLIDVDGHNFPNLRTDILSWLTTYDCEVSGNIHDQNASYERRKIQHGSDDQTN